MLTPLTCCAQLLAIVGWIPPASMAVFSQDSAETMVTPRELELRGSVEFVIPSAPDEVPDGPLHLGRRFVDRLGRVWISKWDTAAIHVFDAEGTAVFSCTPESGDDLRYHPYNWFHLTPQGHLLAGTLDALVEFDPQGRRIACSVQPKSGRRLYAPRGEGHWEVEQREVAFVSPELGRRVIRGPRDAFRGFWPASVAPDGALAVCEEREGSGIGQTKVEPTLHLFASDGKHLATLDLPYEGFVSDLAFDGHEVTLLAHVGLASSCGLMPPAPPWEIWTVSTEGMHVARARLPEDLPALWQVSLSPNGEELWIFPSREPVLYRFARP